MLDRTTSRILCALSLAARTAFRITANSRTVVSVRSPVLRTMMPSLEVDSIWAIGTHGPVVDVSRSGTVEQTWHIVDFNGCPGVQSATNCRRATRRAWSRRGRRNLLAPSNSASGGAHFVSLTTPADDCIPNRGSLCSYRCAGAIARKSRAVVLSTNSPTRLSAS